MKLQIIAILLAITGLGATNNTPFKLLETNPHWSEVALTLEPTYNVVFANEANQITVSLTNGAVTD